MIIRKYNHVSGAEAGDYFQVAFYDNDEEETPHLLIQKQFEFPNYNKCHFMSDEEELIGDYLVEEASLSHDKLTLKLKEYSFDTIVINIKDVIGNHKKAYKVLKIMMPNLTRP